MTVEILRAEDPRGAELARRGRSPVAESWRARLRLGEPPDLAAARAAVERAATAAELAELDERWAERVEELEAVTHRDYPQTPATPHAAPTADDLRGLWRDGSRIFGALVAGRLVAVTVIRASGTAAETDFTSVDPAHRGRGLGAGVKAASVLALAAEGVRTFGTGGAGSNAASLGMNRAVGYRIEERWLTWAPVAGR